MTSYARDPPSYIVNTTDLLLKINTVKIEDDEILASLDVMSLITNVPRRYAFETIQELVQNDSDAKENNETDIILELL